MLSESADAPALIAKRGGISYAGCVNSAILGMAQVIQLVPSVPSLLSSTLRIPRILSPEFCTPWVYLGKAELTCPCEAEIEPELTKREPSSASGELVFDCFGHRLTTEFFLILQFKR